MNSKIEMLSKKRASYGSVLPSDINYLQSYTNKKGDQAQITDTLTINELLDNRKTQHRIRYNIWLSSFALCLIYAGIAPTSLIQSSFNAEGGLGVTSLSINTAFMIAGSIIAMFVISKIGCKSGLIVGSLLYILYIPANFYPTWFTMIPAAIFSGIGKPIKDVAYKVYVAKLGHFYSELTVTDLDRINSRIFAFGMITTQTGVAIGNLVSSIILSSESGNNFDQLNLDVCGANYCNEELKIPANINNATISTEDFKSEQLGVYLVVGFCTLSSLIGVILFAFQDSLHRFGISSNSEQYYVSTIAYAKDFFITMFDPKFILIMPLMIVLYGTDAFWTADFNKAFVTCSIGMNYLGYVAVWGGLTAIFGGLLLGWYNQSSIRCFPIALATFLQLFILIAMFYWTPSTPMANYWSLSIITIIFTFAGSIRSFITPVLVAVIFKDNLETAFSVYHFWGYLSSTIFYALSNLLCMTTKMYLNIVIIPVSFITYILVEVLVYRQNNSNSVPYINLNKQDSESS
ncbi:Protein unc-93 A [Chamberlinius hualienensis]